MIIFNTSHGKYVMDKPNSNLPILEYLRENRIPYNAISIYGQKINGSNLELIVGLNKDIESILSKYENIIIQPDRNIDFPSILNRSLSVDKSKKDNDLVGEYVLDSLNENDNSELRQFTIEEAKNYVNEAVGQVLKETNIDFNKPIVFGISGGGDSNTLLEAFIKNGFPKENLIPVMIHGIPDMDQGTERARQISKEQGLSLIELSAIQIDEILGRKNPDGSWARDYERIFNDDLESIATFVIRIGLSKVAKDNNAQAIVTGLNLEDILAESFTMIAKGYAPAKFPERKILDTRIIYPLYRVPKKIIDATHPKFSLENYIQRFPSKSHWRAISYYFAQNISTTMPGMEFRLIDGLKKVASQNNLDYKLNSAVGFPVLGKLDKGTIKLWKKFMNN